MRTAWPLARAALRSLPVALPRGATRAQILHAASRPACSLQWWPGAKSDPFVVVNVGDSAAVTSVVKQNLDPEWGETFYLFVRWPPAAACAAGARAPPPAGPAFACGVGRGTHAAAPVPGARRAIWQCPMPPIPPPHALSSPRHPSATPPLPRPQRPRQPAAGAQGAGPGHRQGGRPAGHRNARPAGPGGRRRTAG